MIGLISGEKSSYTCYKVFLVFIFLLFLQVRIAVSGEDTEYFPVPKSLRLRVQFWINVFTRYSKHQQIIHDVQKPERIYRIVDFRDYTKNAKHSVSDKEEILKENMKEVELILRKLGTGNYTPNNLIEEEYRIYRLFGKHPKASVFMQAVNNIRAQGGMKEKFKQGVKRSEFYIHTFKQIFEEEGVPEHLIYLAHVESSFNPQAESKYGAVGIWQFTRSTGQMFLTINNKIDERKDPYLSSRAAAKLLKRNYQVLGSWPLAVTAYNHGLYGVKRAVKKSGSREIDEIIQNYSSSRFGFASKNFYAEFIAVLYIIEKLSYPSKIMVLSHP